LQSRGLGMPILFFGVWIFYIFGLFLVFFIKFRKIIINYRLLFLVVNSLLISLLLFSGILLLVNVKFIGFDFRVSADMTHDLAQFMVAIFILVKIFFLILIVFNYESNRKITYSILLLSILSLGGYFSFVSNSFIRNDSKCTLWYKTVLTECNELENNGLFAMKGNSLYSGQVISGQGIGNWYCTGHRSDGGSYGSSLEVDRRNLLIDSFLNRFGTVNENNYLIYKLSKENVKYLIKRPDQEQIFEDLVESGCLSIVQGCRYVYKLQSRLN
jgi:hypothetical protein